jgi:hypothetical protein
MMRIEDEWEWKVESGGRDTGTVMVKVTGLHVHFHIVEGCSTR